MGMYTWLDECQQQAYSKVSDKELNELFQEVREVMPHVFISENIYVRKPLFGKKETIVNYSVYHLSDKQLTSFSEFRFMNLNFSSNALLFNYLCGLLNGYRYNEYKKLSQEGEHQLTPGKNN